MREPYGDLGRYNVMLLEKTISAIFEVSHQAVKMLFVAHGGAIAALVVLTDPSSDGDGGLKATMVAFFLGLVTTVSAQLMLYVGHRGEMEMAARNLNIDVPTIFGGWASKFQTNPYAHAFQLIIASIVMLLVGGVLAAYTL